MAIRRWFPWLLISLITVGCASLPRGDFDQPEVELVALTPVMAVGMEARFRVTLRIVNPNTEKLTINGMAYELFLRDRRVLSGVSNQPIAVEPFSEQAAELEVSAGMLGSLALLRDLVANPPDGAIPYSLRAKLAVGGLVGTLRIQRDGEIDLTSGDNSA